ncbi:MAG: DUF4840 domain-containing protein [Bacteroidales bacterium]|nr:DUF4840 domain-containing protein [Candidatus Equimonas enterica]
MKKISILLFAFTLLFCACSKEEDDYIRLSAKETAQYCEAIAGSYEAKGYTLLVAHKDFDHSEVIGKQSDVDGIYIDIDNDIEHSMTFWHVPVNALANLLPENSDAKTALEKRAPISFLTSYQFETTVASIRGEKLVNFFFQPVTKHFTATGDEKTHLITIEIAPSPIYLPYTADMQTVREEFLKSEVRFDITSMTVDGEEYKHFDLMVAMEIAEASER